MELYYPAHRREDFERIAACARKYGLITTGGRFPRYYHPQPNPIASAITGKRLWARFSSGKRNPQNNRLGEYDYMTYHYPPHGVCSKEIIVDLNGQGIIERVDFINGCPAI